MNGGIPLNPDQFPSRDDIKEAEEILNQTVQAMRHTAVGAARAPASFNSAFHINTLLGRALQGWASFNALHKPITPAVEKLWGEWNRTARNAVASLPSIERVDMIDGTTLDPFLVARTVFPKGSSGNYVDEIHRLWDIAEKADVCFGSSQTYLNLIQVAAENGGATEDEEKRAMQRYMTKGRARN